MANPFPPRFFSRADDHQDSVFYGVPRLVTHIDAGAIAGVGRLYDELALGPRVLDVCGSWVSHFSRRPPALTVLGMNAEELRANPQAAAWVVQDLNAEPVLPFADASFDDATCCVSVDYLTRPVEVFAEVARVLEPGGRFVCTWSNRCFPTKAIAGWLYSDDEAHTAIVRAYFESSAAWGPVEVATRIAKGGGGDPLWAAWAARAVS